MTINASSQTHVRDVRDLAAKTCDLGDNDE